MIFPRAVCGVKVHTSPLENGPKVDLRVHSQDAQKCCPLVAPRSCQALREPASCTAR